MEYPLAGRFSQRVEALFARHGHRPYEGARHEPVTALAHALQCAQLAEWAHAAPELVAAALLHDVGHFLAAEAAAMGDHVDDRHELLALPFLSAACGGPGAAVAEPVRLHVAAKRYLVATDPDYATQLSPASVHTLALQGGPMSPDEAALFIALPYAEDAVALRRWDDLSKQPGRMTPPLAYYLALLDELEQRPFVDSKTGIGALDLA